MADSLRRLRDLSAILPARTLIAFLTVFALIPFIAIYSFTSIAFLLFLGAVIVAKPETLAAALALARNSWPARILILLLLWCLITVLWSPAPAESLGKALGVIAHVGAGLVLISAARTANAGEARSAMRALAAAACVCAAIYLLEWSTKGAIAMQVKEIIVPAGLSVEQADATARMIAFIKIAPGATVLALLIGPATLAASRTGFGWGAALALAASAATFTTAQGTAKLALVVAGLAALAACAAPRLIFRAIGFFGAVLFLAMPFIVKSGWIDGPLRCAALFEASAAHRLHIYRYAVSLIDQRPLLGYGFDASRHLSATAPPLDIAKLNKLSLLPLHPHNAMLQTWLETGAIGAVLAAAFAITLGMALARLDLARPQAAALAATLGAALAILSFGFSVINYAFLGALFIAGAAAALVLRPTIAETS